MRSSRRPHLQKIALALVVLALAISLAAPLHTHAERPSGHLPCVFCDLATAPALRSLDAPALSIEATRELVVIEAPRSHAPAALPTESGRSPPPPSV